VFFGGVGAGVYFTPRFRGDITIDFRGKQNFEANRTYTYTSVTGQAVNGTWRESLKVRGTVTMANAYFDILPRGRFTPYVGAGIGFVYNDVERTHFNQEIIPATGQVFTYNAAAKDPDWGLAAALMAGVSFAFDHRWALDIGYRAQYLTETQGTDLMPSGELSKATMSDHWDHQVRAGLRINIW